MSVCLCMCVFAMRVHVSCSIAVKLAVVAGGIGGQVIVGLTSAVLLFVKSYLPISAFFLCGQPAFSNYHFN